MASGSRPKALYKTAAMRYHLAMTKEGSMTGCEKAGQRPRLLVAFLNRFSGL